MDKTYTLSQAEIAVFDREAYGLMLDIITLWEMVKVRREKRVSERVSEKGR